MKFSFRRSAFWIALAVSAGLGVQANVLQAQAGSSEPAAAPAPQQQTSGALTVQARLKARREQRRVAAIHDVYSHLYEAYVGSGYLRFRPGNTLQHDSEYPWNVGVTRYFNEKLGVTLDARGIYGTTFIPPKAYSNGAITRPTISQYAGMIGPTYRFLLHPKFSVSGRVLAGAAYGNFSSDLGVFQTGPLGLYSDGLGAAVSASAPLEYNVSPTVGLRLAPEYLLTNFGSTIQHNRGFSAALVVRWGKQ